MTRKKAEGAVRTIDRLRTHYNAQRRSIVVKELGGLEVFFTPISAYEVDEVARRIKARGAKAGDFDRNLYLVIFKAKDSEGRELFSMGDFDALKKEADITVLQEIIAFMWADVSAPEKAKEEIKADPIVASD